MWISFRKRRAHVKALIFGFEQFPQTGGNVYGIQTFRCLSHAKVVGFPIRREEKSRTAVEVIVDFLYFQCLRMYAVAGPEPTLLI